VPGRGDAPGAAARMTWVDLIRVVSVFAVIALHVAAVPVTQFTSIPADRWWWANIYDSIMRPCIPLFVMVSGALLLTRPAWNYADFMRRRTMRVAIPFLAWSIAYAVWAYFFHGRPLSASELGYHLIAGMTDPVYTHLWYLPLILGLYLLVPLLHPFVANSTFSTHIYFALLWLFASSVRPVVESRFGVPIGYYLTPAVGYVGYFVLGATISLFAPARLSAGWAVAALATFAAGAIVTAVGTYVLTAQNGGRLDEYFYSHFSPGVVLMSIAAFVLLREAGMALENVRPEVARLITVASTASFGIYLVHMMVVELFSSGLLGFSIGASAFHPALSIPVSAAAIFLGSLMLAVVLRRSSTLRWLVP